MSEGTWFTRMEQTPLHAWSPLIGDRYARRQARFASQSMLGAIGLAAALVVMIALILASQDSIPWVITGILAGAIGYVGWVIPQIRINRLGIELRNELTSAGIQTNRRPPLQSLYLYTKWLTRNSLSAEQVIAALD